MTAAVTVADLRPVDLFDGIDDAQLAEWTAHATVRDAEPGEAIIAQGEHVPGVILLLEGTALTQMANRGQIEPVGHQRAPTWIGAISVLTGDPLPVSIVAESVCHMAIVAPEEFRRLIFAQPAVHQTVMRRVAPVMQRLGGIEQSHERLAALGTMAAGLAHELNNPAAASRRAASALREEVEVVQSTLVKFVRSGVERADAEQLVDLQQEAIARAATATALDALDAADAEDELLERLEALGVAEPWRLAEPLATAGVDEDWLDRVAAVAGPATGPALRWVAATLTIGRVSGELCESTDRISALVGAVKSYAYMDRGGLVEVDLHEGLETTLTVLGHKLKHTAIEVERDYDRALPRTMVRGSELNQVWTNLLDNAIGALGERGTITLTTRRDGDGAVIEVSDDGPGIPDDISERIFEPFFTTKDVGAGTGLGLSTARQIVVERHDGSLTARSEPGRTTFRVRLPITQT
ncbi:MAG: ATP-binding protein [Solirubrobacteraceae bacterium]|nr:ATP-binding protein [Solirubrobacteraceae bacterium]